MVNEQRCFKENEVQQSRYERQDSQRQKESFYHLSHFSSLVFYVCGNTWKKLKTSSLLAEKPLEIAKLSQSKCTIFQWPKNASLKSIIESPL